MLKNLCVHSTRGHSLSTSCGLTGRKGLFVLLRRRGERHWDLPPVSSPPEPHIVFFKKTLFPCSLRKKRKKKKKAKRPCFKQSQEATISLCIMIRRGKARRGRRALVPSPLNSLLCIRQQQQYKQTSQWRVDETLSPLVHSGLHHICLLASAEVKNHCAVWL